MGAKKQSKRPHRDKSYAALEGFLVRAGAADAVRKRASAVVGPGWRIRQVVPSLFFVAAPPDAALTAKRAFAAARQMLDATIDDVEPAFVTSGLQPVNPDAELLPEERPADDDDEQPAPKTTRLRGVTGDADYEWSLKSAAVDTAWETFKVSGDGVVVGHPDTGYTFHDELDGPRLLWQQGHDFVRGDPDPLDELVGVFPAHNPGHGTATGSVIVSDRGRAKKPLRPEFVSGAAFGAKLVPLRVNTRVEHFSFARLIMALGHARAARHDVVSMSLGGPLQSDALEEEVRRCVEEGMILVAAAGQYWPWVIYPARLPEVIGVGAVTSADAPWKRCAKGPTIDVSAPGVDVWVATTERRKGRNVYAVQTSSGTSHATALTAGVACLWLQHHGGPAAVRATLGGRTADVFRAALRKHARVPDGWEADKYGAGIIDAAATLHAPLGGRLRVGARGRVAGGPSWLAFLPPTAPQALDSAMGLMSGKRGREREPHDRELHFHLATNPEFRRAMRLTGQRMAARGLAPASATLPRAALAGLTDELAAVLSS